MSYYQVHPNKVDFTNLNYLAPQRATSNDNAHDDSSSIHNCTTPIQNEVYELLTKHKILTTLDKYQPILVGTIPININIDKSDLDIILYCPSLSSQCDSSSELKELSPTAHFEELQKFLVQTFGQNPTYNDQFKCEITTFQGESILMCHFILHNDLYNNNANNNNDNNDSLKQQNEYIKPFYEIEIFAQSRPTTTQNGYLHMVKEYEVLWYHDQVLQDNGQFRHDIINLKKSGIKTEPAFAQLLNLQGNPYQSLLEYTPPSPLLE